MPAPTEIALNRARVVRREERGDVAALAPAHRADPGGIDQALRDQRVDARQHVPGVADAEVADVQRAELLAVAGAAAIVRLEHEDAARHPHVDRIDGAGERHRRARRRSGPPWITTSSGYLRDGSKSDRLVQHAFDRRAVLALPRHDFERARRPVRGLRVHVGELSGIRHRRGRDEHLRHRFRASEPRNAILRAVASRA